MRLPLAQRGLMPMSLPVPLHDLKCFFEANKIVCSLIGNSTMGVATPPDMADLHFNVVKLTRSRYRVTHWQTVPEMKARLERTVIEGTVLEVESELFPVAAFVDAMWRSYRGEDVCDCPACTGYDDVTDE